MYKKNHLQNKILFNYYFNGERENNTLNIS